MSSAGRLSRLFIFALFGIAAAWATATGFRHAEDLWRAPDWPATTAEVLDVIAAPGQDSGYRLRVRLLRPDGQAVTADTIDLIGEGQLSILREVGSGGHAGPHPTALIYYRPDRPGEVRLSRESGTRTLAVLYGALALASGLLSLTAFRRAASLGLSPGESRP